MARSKQTFGNFGLSLGETEAPGKLHVPDSGCCVRKADCRPRPLSQDRSEIRDTALV
jgi:hypothetical protein